MIIALLYYLMFSYLIRSWYFVFSIKLWLTTYKFKYVESNPFVLSLSSSSSFLILLNRLPTNNWKIEIKYNNILVS